MSLGGKDVMRLVGELHVAANGVGVVQELRSTVERKVRHPLTRGVT